MSVGHPRDEPSDSRAPTDRDLLARIATGDGAAFGALAERLGPVLRRVLFRLGLTETEVEDVLQDALVRIWQGSARFEGRSAVPTWACRIALNLGVSTLRARKRAAGGPVGVLDAEAVWERRWQAQQVREAVLALPLRLRTVIVLREFEDLPYRTIAEILGIPIGTVMSRLHEARRRLRSSLGRTLVRCVARPRRATRS